MYCAKIEVVIRLNFPRRSVTGLKPSRSEVLNVDFVHGLRLVFLKGWARQSDVAEILMMDFMVQDSSYSPFEKSKQPQ